jgi:hypothetical protein
MIRLLRNHGKAGKLTGMKMAKAIRQQAATAERMAVNTTGTESSLSAPEWKIPPNSQHRYYVLTPVLRDLDRTCRTIPALAFRKRAVTVSPSLLERMRRGFRPPGPQGDPSRKCRPVRL